MTFYWIWRKGLNPVKYRENRDPTDCYREIRKLAEAYEIEQALLFGSGASGDYWASDIDLAVSGGNIDKFSLDVKDTASTLLDFNEDPEGLWRNPE